MVWWGWFIVGFLLMAAELLGVEAAFYLVFLGAAALIVGAIEALGPGLPVQVQWLLFSVCALGSMVLFRKRLYDRFRGGLKGYQGAPVGAVMEVSDAVPPGGRTRVQLRGSNWDAVNVGRAPVEAGDSARVVEVHGVVLHIEPAAAPEPSSETESR